MGDVFLVGAGFSKAISSEMPTLRELSTAVYLPRAQGSAPSEAQDSDFESALSFLAQEQPWLTPSENLRNRASFLEASKDIARHLSDMQTRALGADPPSWLLQLVKWWMDAGSTVITTNYDMLIERAYKQLQSDGDHRSLYAVPITYAVSRVATPLGGAIVGPFTLLKLHGSLSWYYSGRESFYGEPIFDAEVPTGWRTNLHSVEEAATRAVTDKTPLVIPPTFGKSTFFQSETILAIWRSAWSAITEADRLICVGYSLPSSDLNMVHLLRGVSVRPGRVLVVNENPDALRHYRQLLPGIDVESEGDGPQVVASFVGSLDAAPS